jgi:hypothetical protein
MKILFFVYKVSEKVHDEICEHNYECNKDKGLRCFRNKCSCESNYYWEDMICSKSLVSLILLDFN